MTTIFTGPAWTDAAVMGPGTTTGATGAEGSNLLTDRRSEFYRTLNSVATATVTIDLQQDREVDHISLLDIVGPTSIEMSVRAWVSDQEFGGTPIQVADHVVPAAVDGGRHFSVYLPEAITNRWIRMSIYHLGAAQQQLGASRVMVGGAWAPQRSMLQGSGVVTPGSASDVTETESGGRFIRHLYTRRRARPVLEATREEQIGPFWDLVGYCGTNRPIVFVQSADLDANDVELALQLNKGLVYGTLPDTDTARAEYFDGFSLTLELEEWT